MKIPSVNWPKFYSGLGKMVVHVPIHGEGELVPPVVIERLLVQVQARRQKVDDVARRVLETLGSLRSSLSVAEHDLRIARTTYASDPAVSSLRSTKDRTNAVESLVSREHELVSNLKGAIAQHDNALRACKMMTDTFDRAKETLNAMHRGAVAEMGRGAR